VNPETFRRQLSALLQGAAESGLDPFFLHGELSLAGMELLDNCRADLAEADEADDEVAPY
jgi:hypothetical protein